MSGGKFTFTVGPGAAIRREEDDPALAAAFAEASGAPGTPELSGGPVGEPKAFEDTATTDDELERSAAYGWLAPAALVALGLAWTLWYATGHLVGLTSGDPALVSALIGNWAAPVMLLAVAWLIIQRSSRREAGRFADAARALSEESSRLEARLTVVNRELSLAREFIAEQARDLESVGRVAVDRLSQNADRLATLIRDNGAQVEAIGTVSAAALENMERLRGQLPVMTSAAKDVTNNIGNAGRTAQLQLQELVSGFNRLNEFGQASERQVVTLRARIDEALDEFTTRSAALDESAQTRLDLLTQGATDFRTRLLDHHGEAQALLGERGEALAAEIAAAREALDHAEAEGLTSLRARLTALRDEAGAIGRAVRNGEALALADWRTTMAGVEADLGQATQRLGAVEQAASEATHARAATLAEQIGKLEAQISGHSARFDVEIAHRRSESEEADRSALARVSALLETFDGEWQRRHAAQGEQFARLGSSGEDLRGQLRMIEDHVGAIADAGADAEATLGARLDMLARRIEDARGALVSTDGSIAHLTEGSVRLLELIQAGARHSSEDLVVAIGKGESRLAELESRALLLRDTVDGAHQRGEQLSTYVRQTHEELGVTTAALASLHDDLGQRALAHGEALAGLRATLATLDSETGDAAARARGELADAIAALEGSARAAIAEIEVQGAGAITAVAARLGEESGAAIERSLRLHLADVGGRLEQAAAHASGVSREATMQLRDQLVRVDELVGNLESRVTQARARAEEQVDNDFARRVALITESLNSNAIDIAKALDTDVSDSAWASYLRGDRGIFTRRAVKLLDAGEAKTVAHIYESDREFREHVSHYIHDFEAMLRQLLSTRDGHALGVTLLSSDMGKLYVALAQAIERLRN